MNWIFLQTAGIGDVAGMFAGVGIALIIVYLIVVVALWIYSALAFSAIARRAGSDKGALAWIPGVGTLIVSYILSGMHWWPWLLLISILIFWVPILGWIVFPIAMIIFAVYSIIWMWKTYEAVGRPGWWAIMPIIPFVGGILYLIFVGIAAWGKGGSEQARSPVVSAKPVMKKK